MSGHMTTVRFRQAELTDAPALLGLMRPFYVLERMVFDPLRTPAALRALLSCPEHGQAWLLEAVDERGGNAEPVGYFVLACVFVLEFGGRCAFVDELFIVPAHRGRGLGTKALERAAAIGAEIGLTALRLEVDHANPDAARLYQRTGFERHERALLTRRIRLTDDLK